MHKLSIRLTLVRERPREFWCCSWSHSSSLGVTAPSAPITTETTLTFTFHVLSSSSFSPWYFSSFSYSFFLMLLSLGTAMSITTASLFSLSLKTMSCLSGSGSPTGALPCYSPEPSEEFPTWTWVPSWVCTPGCFGFYPVWWFGAFGVISNALLSCAHILLLLLLYIT